MPSNAPVCGGEEPVECQEPRVIAFFRAHPQVRKGKLLSYRASQPTKSKNPNPPGSCDKATATPNMQKQEQQLMAACLLESPISLICWVLFGVFLTDKKNK